MSRSPGLRERLRARIPSIAHFFTRARRDWRLALYDLLPLVSTPQRRNRLAGWIARFRPKTRDFVPSVGLRLIDAELTQTGMTLALPPIDGETVMALRRYFELIECRDPANPHLARFAHDDPAPETEAGHFSAAEILAAPGLLGLLNAPDLLSVAELYLGCKPLLDHVTVSWSYGGRDATGEGRRFHRDFDALRGLKLFIYLSNVGADADPPVYARGSHASPFLGTGKSQGDRTIHALFGPENIAAMTGHAGTRILIDNFGFHKGALPRFGARLMVTAEYNVHPSPHAPRPPVLKSVPVGLVIDRDVNRLHVGCGRIEKASILFFRINNK
ncbi:MAG TPA: hypothetical protein VL574_17355 [Stellaceae bacterium]|nr:hypothetical protein [Stellaceae bacterium]